MAAEITMGIVIVMTPKFPRPMDLGKGPI